MRKGLWDLIMSTCMQHGLGVGNDVPSTEFGCCKDGLTDMTEINIDIDHLILKVKYSRSIPSHKY